MSAAGRVRRAGAWIRARYLGVDPRAAAIFRILLGALLCLDALRHYGVVDFIYSMDGAFTNHYHLFKPTAGTLFSLFHAFSTKAELTVLFALGVACHLCLLVGYRARLFTVLSFLFVTSRDARIPLIENGGYVVLNLACMWACFLPLAQRFSVDAWRASWRATKEISLDDLAARARPAAPTAMTRSLVGLAVVMNLAVLYLFNVVNKTGYIWREGTSVHYVLHIDRMVTGLGVFMRENIPLGLLKVADFVTLAWEAMICMLILSPRARRITRPLAIAMMVGLHGTFGTVMRLGPFSWTLIVWSSLLLLPVHFDRLSRRYEGRSRGCELGVDVSSPFALAVARVVSRLDHAERVAFVAAPEGAVLAARADAESPFDAEPRRVLARVAEALPYGRWLLRGMTLASLGTLPRLFEALLANRARVERAFGLTTRAEPDAPAPSPLGSKLRRVGVFGREALAGYLILCASLQTWIENKIILKSIPPPLKNDGKDLRPDERWWYDKTKQVLGGRVIPLKPERSPEFLQLTINYPRTFQGWGMFAPNPIRDDGILAVDLLTIDGRHVDPLTGKPPDLDLTDSRGEGLSQIRQDYGNRIRLDRNEPYREGLRDYLSRYHQRTKNPKDEPIAIDVYWVRDECPPPGQTKPIKGDAVPLLSWRKPNYKPGPGQPKLPARLKPRSAEKDEKDEKDEK
jgi:hypothetical protein